MKYSNCFLIVIVLTVSKLSAQGFSNHDQAFQEILSHHNKVRKAVGSPSLVLSSSLGTYAQQWAEHLASRGSRIYHSDCIHPDGRNLGENIFWGSSYADYSPVEASKSWYEEKLDYTYAPIGATVNKKVGHYTQMVWKDTREMGLGVAYTKKGGIIVVASYYPAGNIVGSYPY